MSNEATETINNNTNEGRTNMNTEISAEEVINNISNECYDLLVEYDHNATRSGVRKVVETAYMNKYRLREIFRKNPKWDEENQRIVIKGDYYRPIDRRIPSEFFYNMWQYVYKTLPNNSEGRDKELKWDAFRWTIEENLTQFLEDDVVDKINNIFPELRFHYGAKLSKVVDKVMKVIYKADEIRDIGLFNKRDANGASLRDEDGNFILEEKEYRPYFKWFSKLGDAVNPIKEKRWVIISLNPVDMFTMSFFTKGASCHTIDKKNKRKRDEAYHGMYCGGTLSYALDYVSAIVYTLKDDYDPETAAPVYWNGHPYNGFETQDKLLRQMIHYEGNVMIQGRLYPRENDGGLDLYKTYREIEEKVIADGLGRPNLWKYIRGTDVNREHAETADGAHNYEDYFWYDPTGTCILKNDDGEYKENDYLMTIGHAGIDVNTGYEIDGSSDYHGVLTETDMLCCAQCGQRLDEDDAIYIDGEAYCSSCVTWCEYHQQYEVDGEYGFTYIRNYGYACDDAIDDMIREGTLQRCEVCGELSEYDPYGVSDGYYDSDGYWYCCESCYENAGLVYSSMEGSLIPESCAVELDGEWYWEGTELCCDDCGRLVSVEDMKVAPNGQRLCSTCYDSLDDWTVAQA